MLHDIFGEITFSVGWKADKNIQLFGKDYPIKVKIQAYFEEDGITEKQEKSYLEYKEAESDKLHIIEKLLCNYVESPATRFVPKILLFDRDGSYALLCDDNAEPDEGIAVCLSPKEQVMSQDDYL